MRMEFKKRELIDLFKSWIALSLAFGILLTPSLTPNYETINAFVISFGISLIIIALSFIVHELAHKLIAQKFYCQAEYKSNDSMLAIAILMSFLGFIFAAPGAVWIKGSINKKQNGIISFAGPFSNFLLALAFLPGLFFASGLVQFFLFIGFFINSWLGLFNMIPFRPFDGIKIYKWNKIIYIGLTALLLIAVIFGLRIY